MGNVLRLSVVILVGSASHIVWDAFTHKGEWGVMLLPGLSNSVEFAGITLPGYKLFQYGRTIFGLPLLAGLILIKLKRQKSIINNRYFQIPLRWNLAIVASFCLVPIAIAYHYLQQPDSFQSVVGQIIKQSIGAELLLFLILAIFYKLFLANNYREYQNKIINFKYKS